MKHSSRPHGMSTGGQTTADLREFEPGGRQDPDILESNDTSQEATQDSCQINVEAENDFLTTHGGREGADAPSARPLDCSSAYLEQAIEDECLMTEALRDTVGENEERYIMETNLPRADHETEPNLSDSRDFWEEKEEESSSSSQQLAARLR